jgi:pyruvate dehydrogenase E2 component (dihydrolipoamide acetyltransferase)
MDILMPQLGETVTEGTVTVWHKKIGDAVKANEVLFEVSTDKVDTEIPAPVAGVLAEIAVAEGETVDVGTRLAILAEDGAAVAPPAETAGVDVIMPQLGETVTEGTVTSWHKSVGDVLAMGDILFEVSTDKVDTEIPAPVAGVLTEILVKDGETVDVGVRLGVIAAEGGATLTTGASRPSVSASSTPTPKTDDNKAALAGSVRNQDSRGLPLSPVVRRLVAEHKLDADRITGTGRDGRVTRRDVLAAIAAAPAVVEPLMSPMVRNLIAEHRLNANRITATGQDGRITKGDVLAALAAGANDAPEIIPLSRLRKQIGDHMVRSKATSPHVLQAVEVDFHGVDAVRAAHKDAWRAAEGFGLTYLPFIARAVCDAIAEFPNINASIEGDNMIIHHRVNLGIAVDLGPDGLIAPVLKDAHDKSLREIAREISTLAGKARSGGLMPDDLTEGTYTLSNSGPFGTLITAPIINQPQVAILSTDGVRKKPVVIEAPQGDSIAIRPVGVLAQSFDHRAVDGAYSGSFLNRLREIIETRDWSGEI